MGEVSVRDVDRQALDRVLAKLAEHADAVEQLLDVVGRLQRSGLLAAVDGVMEEFDEQFSAATRPELMTLVANAMMLLGVLGQVRYEPLFRLALYAAQAANEKLAQPRTRPMRVREVWQALRSPEVAQALEVLLAALRALRPPQPAR
ncbi:MAG: hypothetical protein QN158_07215 [Armatimonadota bacterium]|nr:hypothetical protein [Armatimonadota bacterium]MDR7480311.1 hypothetical protein [Armatimonadota bacterium]MDR7502148.1 hypothetical protein [Armatimonadota bacterium]MDR7528006.1 hypothetical protein [Armatimonadota bacterium]MDR7576093.1 hypothetical protein [Armatimonadota bacterium]